jgi:hypothetical protein
MSAATPKECFLNLLQFQPPQKVTPVTGPPPMRAGECGIACERFIPPHSTTRLARDKVIKNWNNLCGKSQQANLGRIR